jgi:hypothetical protein
MGVERTTFVIDEKDHTHIFPKVKAKVIRMKSSLSSEIPDYPSTGINHDGHVTQTHFAAAHRLYNFAWAMRKTPEPAQQRERPRPQLQYGSHCC